jgi:hypothetical protein
MYWLHIAIRIPLIGLVRGIVYRSHISISVGTMDFSFTKQMTTFQKRVCKLNLTVLKLERGELETYKRIAVAKHV